MQVTHPCRCNKPLKQRSLQKIINKYSKEILQQVPFCDQCSEYLHPFHHPIVFACTDYQDSIIHIPRDRYQIYCIKCVKTAYETQMRQKVDTSFGKFYNKSIPRWRDRVNWMLNVCNNRLTFDVLLLLERRNAVCGRFDVTSSKDRCKTEENNRTD